VFVLEVGPFQSTFTNARLIIVAGMFIGINVVCSIYVKMSMDNAYVFVYEEVMVYMIVALVGLAVLFAVLEHILAWKR
jgi:hypothetical protein